MMNKITKKDIFIKAAVNDYNNTTLFITQDDNYRIIYTEFRYKKKTLIKTRKYEYAVSIYMEMQQAREAQQIEETKKRQKMLEEVYNNIQIRIPHETTFAVYEIKKI